MLKIDCGVPDLPRRGVNKAWIATSDQPLHPDLPVNAFSDSLVIKHGKPLVGSLEKSVYEGKEAGQEL